MSRRKFTTDMQLSTVKLNWSSRKWLLRVATSRYGRWPTVGESPSGEVLTFFGVPLIPDPTLSLPIIQPQFYVNGIGELPLSMTYDELSGFWMASDPSDQIGSSWFAQDLQRLLARYRPLFNHLKPDRSTGLNWTLKLGLDTSPVLESLGPPSTPSVYPLCAWRTERDTGPQKRKHIYYGGYGAF
jgi:hypothetical protein